MTLAENLNIFSIYDLDLKEMFLFVELFISGSILQLTFYVTSISYIRRSGFIILSQQIYHIGFLILFLSLFLIFNEDLLFQTVLSLNDYLSFFSKLILCISSLFFIFIIKTSSNDDLKNHNFEFVVLVLTGVLGSLFLCSSNDLLTAYLAMELQSVAFYLMAAFKKNSNYSIESGLKYFVVGSFASAFFLFGSSFIYGSLGSLRFDDFKLFLNLLTNFYSPISFRRIHYISFYSDFQTILDCLENCIVIFLIKVQNLNVLNKFFYYPFTDYHGEESYFFEFPVWFLVEHKISPNVELECTCFPCFSYIDMADQTYDEIFNDAVAVLDAASIITSYILVDKLFFPFQSTFSDYYCLNVFQRYINPYNFSKIYSNFDSFSYIACEITNKVNYFSIFDGDLYVNNIVLNLELIYIGFLFICLSLLIKLAVAPFHYWSLDVYEGSPNQSTFFFAVVPKIGLFVLLIRICYSGFYNFLINWQFIFLVLSVFSVFVGSLGGLEQRKLKSLLAYSSISHTGYLLLSFSTNIMEGAQMMMYYIVIFMLSGLCFWSIYMFLRKKIKINYYSKQNKELGDLILLRESNPMLALSLIITLFSIAGIPPLVGFLAKLGVFLAALSSSIYIVALLNILLSVLSTFYYIRLIKIIYFENVLTGKLYYPIFTYKASLISILFLNIILLSVFPMVLYFVSHKAILLI